MKLIPLAVPALLTILGTSATAQPSVFSPSIERECILSWFGLSASTGTISELSDAYNETSPVRLAAVLNLCSHSAGSTAKPCDEICAAEIQVGMEMRRRMNGQMSLMEIDRLR